MRVTFPLAAAVLLLAACSPHDAAQPATTEVPVAHHPVSGLEIIPLTVTTNGKPHRFMVEVAATPHAQTQGLMFRKTLGPDEGMIFPRNPPGYASFWMKNTPLPLDIIFIGVDGKILNIAAKTTPYSLDPIPSDGVAAGVLEIAGGRAADLGIKPGDTVKW